MASAPLLGSRCREFKRSALEFTLWSTGNREPQWASEQESGMMEKAQLLGVQEMDSEGKTLIEGCESISVYQKEDTRA